ncbi:hypothetical protein V5E97_14870 [Singulisphaera sp. Ch08]|uniref:Uncharacterized protein n=1 Tax=Singulisphaera sp. Ch08 TaxID=3120278 RepID=A0AAU7CQ42_9BACT
MLGTSRFTAAGFALSALMAWSIPYAGVHAVQFRPVAKKKAATAPAGAPPIATERSALAFGYGGKIGPQEEGFIPGFESYKLRFGPGDWAGARIIVSSAWGDENPSTDLWDWTGGLNVRCTDVKSDKDGFYIIYSLATANAAKWVVVNFRYTLRDGRHGVANALIPYQGNAKIPTDTVAVLGFGGKVGPTEEGYIPKFESYKLRFGPGDWSGTKVFLGSNWGEGSGAIDVWGWRGTEARLSEVRRDPQGYYFIHSVLTAGHSRWVSSLFRFSRKDGRTGVAQALHSYSGALPLPKPTGQPAGYPAAAASTVKKRPKPTERILAAARPTKNDLVYLQSLSDEFEGMEFDDFAALTELDLRGKAIDDEGMVHLRGLKQLRTLSLNETRVGDAGLENIAGLKNLQKLHLIDTPTTNAGLEVVSRLTNLTELFISGTCVTDSGFPVLRRLRKLNSLAFSTTDVGDAGLAVLADLPELYFLNIGKDPAFESEQFTLAGLAGLKKIPRLARLVLDRLKLSEGSFAQLRGLPKISRLSLTSTNVTDADLVHLQELPELNELYLDGTPVTNAGLVHLKSIPTLQYLHLGYSDIGDAGLAHIAGLKNLELLAITKAKVTDAGLIHIKGLTQLKRLHLPDNNITGAGLANLQGLTKLYRLTLYANSLNNASLAHLKSLPELQQLSISGEQITDEGLVHLKALANLHYLSITWTKATQAGIDDLKKSRPNLEVEYGDF